MSIKQEMVFPFFEVLRFKKVTKLEAILIGHTKALLHGTAKYPLTKLGIRILNKPRKSSSWNQEAVIHGRLPQRILICLTGNVNFNGTYHINLFWFHHYKWNSIYLYRDGNQVVSKS